MTAFSAAARTLRPPNGARRRVDGSPAGASSPNGSMRDIAGIVNPAGNVLGMMPHPERACEPLLGSDDGMRLFLNVARAVSRGAAFAAPAS